MNGLGRAIQILQQAETSLREIASKAVIAGQYGSVAQAAAWARAVGELVRNASAGERDTPLPDGARRITQSAKPTAAGVRQTARTAQPNRYPRSSRAGHGVVRHPSA